MGHQERENRQNVTDEPKETPEENLRVSIRGSSGQKYWSLKDLEDDFKSKPEWKVIEDGGVLSIPVEELRMQNPPRPNRSGQVHFQEVARGGGKQIENYPVGQTVENLNKITQNKYEEEKKKALDGGKPEPEACAIAFTAAKDFLNSRQ